MEKSCSVSIPFICSISESCLQSLSRQCRSSIWALSRLCLITAQRRKMRIFVANFRRRFYNRIFKRLLSCLIPTVFAFCPAHHGIAAVLIILLCCLTSVRATSSITENSRFRFFPPFFSFSRVLHCPRS